MATKENIGDSFAIILLVVTIMIFLFAGDPDIADAIRDVLVAWAKSITIQCIK